MLERFRPRRSHCYLFAHVAKCGGTTLVESFGKWGPGGICLAEPSPSRNAIVAEAQAIIAARRLKPDRVELFFGHRVHYGLHQLSALPPRYFTFLRDPLTRVVSLYNHHCGIADDPQHPHHQRDLLLMGPAADRMSFMEWLNTVYTGNHMVRFLAFAADGIDPEMPGPIDESELMRAQSFLDRCWFIGTTETSDTDIPFVYQQMGIRPPKARSNVSRTYQSAGSTEVEQAITAKDQLDLRLYQYALKLRDTLASPSHPTRLNANVQ